MPTAVDYWNLSRLSDAGRRLACSRNLAEAVKRARAVAKILDELDEPVEAPPVVERPPARLPAPSKPEPVKLTVVRPPPSPVVEPPKPARPDPPWAPSPVPPTVTTSPEVAIIRPRPAPIAAITIRPAPRSSTSVVRAPPFRPPRGFSMFDGLPAPRPVPDQRRRSW